MASEGGDITVILQAMSAAIINLYPTLDGKNQTTVLIKAAPATEGSKVPQPGWTPGSVLPCFCLSQLPAEEIDQTSGNFENVSIDYAVALEYAKSSAPQNWGSDPDIRQKRLDLMNLFYGLPIPGFPANVFGVKYIPLPVYAGNAAENVVVSGQVFLWSLTVARPGVTLK